MIKAMKTSPFLHKGAVVVVYCLSLWLLLVSMLSSNINIKYLAGKNIGHGDQTASRLVIGCGSGPTLIGSGLGFEKKKYTVSDSTLNGLNISLDF